MRKQTQTHQINLKLGFFWATRWKQVQFKCPFCCGLGSTGTRGDYFPLDLLKAPCSMFSSLLSACCLSPNRQCTASLSVLLLQQETEQMKAVRVSSWSRRVQNQNNKPKDAEKPCRADHTARLFGCIRPPPFIFINIFVCILSCAGRTCRFNAFRQNYTSNQSSKTSHKRVLNPDY